MIERCRLFAAFPLLARVAGLRDSLPLCRRTAFIAKVADQINR